MTPSTAARLGSAILRIRPAPLASLLKMILLVRRLPFQTAEGRFWVDPASYLGQEILRAGVYEPDIVATLRALLPAGGSFVDLGANEGYFSVIGSLSVGPTGQVLAIEPQRRLTPVIRRNLELNGCTNVTIASVAISDHAGAAAFHLTADVNTGASGLRAPTKYPLRRQPVVLATLEQILDQHHITQCDLLKIDIEGWEYEAVLGSRRVFEQHRVRQIALELHQPVLATRGRSEHDILGFLHSCGYRELPDLRHLVLRCG